MNLHLSKRIRRVTLSVWGNLCWYKHVLHIQLKCREFLAKGHGKGKTNKTVIYSHKPKLYTPAHHIVIYQNKTKYQNRINQIIVVV